MAPGGLGWGPLFVHSSSRVSSPLGSSVQPPARTEHPALHPCTQQQVPAPGRCGAALCSPFSPWRCRSLSPPRRAPRPAPRARSRCPGEPGAARGGSPSRLFCSCYGRRRTVSRCLLTSGTCTISSWGSWGNGRRWNPKRRRGAAGPQPGRDTLRAAPPSAAPRDPPRTELGLPDPPAPRCEERPRRGGRDVTEPSRCHPRERACPNRAVRAPQTAPTAPNRTEPDSVVSAPGDGGRRGGGGAAYRDPPHIATLPTPRSPPQFPSGPLRRCGPVGAGGRRKAAPVAAVAGGRSGGRRAEGGAVPLCERAGMVRGAGRSPLPCHSLDAGQHLLPPQLMRA